MSKYCLYRDRPIGLATAAQQEGNIEGLGCMIFKVWHKCIDCPNCIEMGNEAISHKALGTAGTDMWPNYLKENKL